MSDLISSYTREVLERNTADIADLNRRAQQEERAGNLATAAHLRELAARREANAQRLTAKIAA